MLSKKTITNQSMDTGKSGSDILLTEWNIWLFFSLAAFFVASMLMTGWPAGLIPNIRYPYTYSGDGLYHLALTQRVIEEGWFFNNNRMGFPFGGNFLDLPVTNTGSLVILKMIGVVFGSPQAANNLYFLISFPVTFICSYVFLRIIGISRSFSVSAGLLFVFLPFHFQRIEHLSYVWYFVVPIFFYFGFRLFFSKPSSFQGRGFRYRVTWGAIVLFFSAFFGGYYACFGCLVLVVSAVAGAIKNKSYQHLIVGFTFLAIIILGVFVNVVPNIQYQTVAGGNVEVAQRYPFESEIYGLKLVQMLLPRQGHRVRYLRNLATSYSALFPLVNENVTSALGVVGATGFISLLGVALALICKQPVDFRLAFFGIVTIFLFFFSTVGGFSVLISMAVSPMIRAWNRLSVFIGFGAIAGAFLILQISLKRFLSKKLAKKMMLPVATALCLLGFLDQTSQTPRSYNDSIRVKFENDRTFIRSIEEIVPVKSAIYQLPYMAFPESPLSLYQLSDYGLFIGFLHSNFLRWSYGGMKGREGDLFFRMLARQPLQKQVEVINKLGFAGVYIDRRGFQDHGRGLEDQLQQILGEGPQLQSPDGDLAFFKLPHVETPLKEGLSPREIMEKVSFDQYGLRYQATLAEGIDFRRSDLPSFVREIRGLSDGETWGRWSDARLSKSVGIEFFKPLPTSFTLVVRAMAFGPNCGAPVRIQIGDYVATVVFSEGMKEKWIKVVTKSPAFKIEIFPPIPKDPLTLGLDSDSRKLGIGFERIWIENNFSMIS